MVLGKKQYSSLSALQLAFKISPFSTLLYVIWSIADALASTIGITLNLLRHPSRL